MVEDDVNDEADQADDKDTGCCNGCDLGELIPGGGAREFEDP